MAQYGYMYTSASSYNTIREESRGPAIKPFVPFVPNSNYDPSTNSDGYATKKKIVPVASRPYDDYDDDYKKRSSPTSGEWNHRQRSPDHVAQRKVDDFLTKVQNEASRPQWNSLPTNDWRHSPQATSYNGPAFSYANANGSDYVGNKDVRKPIASTIRDDGYAGPNGYGGYGNHNNKEGHRPSSSPNRNDKYSGYGDYDNNEGHRSIKSPKYGGYNGGNAYGDYGNHNKEELKPIRGNEGYGAPNSGYGSYNNREEQRPFGSSPKSVNYGGNGYGDYAGDYTNKDRHKPISVSWTHPPRKGTQLSEPTNNMDKALELLKEAARVSSNDLSNKGGHKAASPTALPYENRDDYLLRHGGADKSASSNSWAAGLGKAPKSKFDKSMELVKEAEKLKSIVTAPSVDKRDLTNQFANLNISSKPKTPPKHSTFIGREVDYNRRDYGNAPIINSRTAEEIYGGRRI
ncbi:hypothetical protein HN51_054962 [Arachis hypogaea]|uniref:Uncharacterized protein n=1 Tax=Arachis hypogaea TaxID=3818 RepID=A0A6B9V9Y8_ARAHY|nr:uncharacterized protein DS421_19g654140 [Arachis hypogaea]